MVKRLLLCVGYSKTDDTRPVGTVLYSVTLIMCTMLIENFIQYKRPVRPLKIVDMDNDVAKPPIANFLTKMNERRIDIEEVTAEALCL